MKFRPGAFLRIRLPDGSFGYGRQLDEPYMAFYERRTEDPLSELEALESCPIAFRLVVRHQRGGAPWEVIGHRPLDGEAARPVVRFMQDLADLRKCTIFDSVGMERPAAPQECIGLERAAAWERHHVEQRLLDFFLGRPNEAEIRLRVRLE